MEIDREVSFDAWGMHPFWRNFESVFTPLKPVPESHYRALVDGQDSVAIGLWTMDCYHECRSELHPVFALAVKSKNSPTSGDTDAWHFFIRNKGNQAVCGEEFVVKKSTPWYLRLPGRPGGLKPKITTQDTWAQGEVTWKVLVKASHIVIEATLPEDDDWLIGTVIIEWH